MVIYELNKINQKLYFDGKNSIKLDFKCKLLENPKRCQKILYNYKQLGGLNYE